MTRYTIRTVTEKDCADVLHIYAYYIENAPSTFEVMTPSITAFTQRVMDIASMYPFLVYEEDGVIQGYAYASQYRERPAYKHSVSLSVYINKASLRLGIGSKLYTALLPRLPLQGLYTAFAAITLPSAQSVQLHKKFGFSEIGIFKNVGYKFDAWHDVLWMQKTLQEYTIPPHAVLCAAQVDTE